MFDTTLSGGEGFKRKLLSPPQTRGTMLALVIFSGVTSVAVLMLILSVRSLTWHKISPFWNTILLVLVLLSAWQVVIHDGSITFEHGLLFSFCALLGLLVGFVRGQAARMRFDFNVGDVICRRGAFLIFCWAAVAVTNVTILDAPALGTPAWQLGLPAALLFLTGAFLTSTLTLFVRSSAMRAEYLERAAREQTQQETQVG